MTTSARKIHGEKFYIGVDLGGTKISAALVDPQGSILIRQKYPTAETTRPSDIGRQIENIIKEILLEGQVGSGSLYGIGVGIPGIVSPKNNAILVTPNVHLAGYPLAARLRKSFRTRIVLGNDVNLGTAAEQWLGAGKGVQNIVGIFLGTGVGGGIIIDGKIYTGAQGAGGELGHMIIDLHSPLSSAGDFGTLEALASRRAIEGRIREALRRKKKTIIRELAGNKPKVIKSRMICKALQKKDPVVTGIIDDACHVLGKACISLRHIFNPEMIIFGGGLIEACGEFILPKVRKISEKDPFLAGIDHCKIVPSVLGDDAVIYGAVALVKQLRN